MGVILPKPALQALGWWQADHVKVTVEGDKLMLHNLTQRKVQPIHNVKDYGDGLSRKS